jgi:TRAP-type C4-dicarboxylate transport system permease small subunit
VGALVDQGGEDGNTLPPRKLWFHERVLEAVAIVCVGLLCATICISIVSRLLGRSIVPDEVRWVEMMMIAITMGSLAVTFAERMSIEVEVFTNRAGQRVLKALTVFGHCVGLMFVSFFLWATWRLFASAWRTGEYYRGVVDIPEWIGTGVFVICLLVAWFRLLGMIVIDLRQGNKA